MPSTSVGGIILRIADCQEKGYSEFEAQLETMKYLSDLYGFSFMEV